MAITRAQQVRQMLEDGGMLVSPSLDGKRPGYRGVGGYRGGPGGSGGKGGREAPGSEGSGFESGDNVGRDRDETPPQQIIGGKSYDVLVNDLENKKLREEAEEVAQARRLAAKNQFINRPPKPINTPFPFVNVGLNAAQNFLPYKVTRRFYADDVVGRTVTLPDGTTVTYDFDNYDEYDQLRKEGIINAYGRPLTDAERSRFDDDSNDNQIFFPEDMKDNTGGDGNDSDDDDDTNTGGLGLRYMSRGGSPMDAPTEGGIMDLETGRQMYFLGKLVKKATRAVKKIAKSPIGKAALLYAGGAGLASLGTGSSFMSNLMSPTSLFRNLAMSGKGFLTGVSGGALQFPGSAVASNAPGAFKLGEFLRTPKGIFSAGALALTPLLFGQQEDDEEDLTIDRGPKLDIPYIRGNPYTFRSRIGDGTGLMTRAFQDGGSTEKEPVAKKTMPLLDMDGKEMDLREDGGFVPIGRMEKADDVPARLSKNEFVFTADAVRNAGEGDVDKGAEVMYNMMKNLESGGEVSEESQGLQGARKMFQTSKRLEEVL
jgi:hypothetical protein